MSERLDRLRRDARAQPKNPRLWAALGKALLDKDDREAALAALGRAAESKELDAHTAMELGRGYDRLKRPQAATTMFRRACELEPESAQAHSSLGQSLLKEERALEASSVLAVASWLEPGSGEIRLALGNALLRAGCAAEAQEQLAHAARIAPELSFEGGGFSEMLGAMGGGEQGNLAPSLTPSGAAIAGDLQLVQLIDLLEFLRQNRRSGILRMVSPQGIGEVHLSGGRLAGVTTTTSERLGELMVREGLLGEADLQRAIGHQAAQETRRALGQVVMDLGLVDAEALKPLINHQVQHALAEVLRWKEGHFAFEAGEAINRHPGLEFDTAHTMFEALRMIDEEAR